jgi:type IV secretion system protein TrbC
LLQKHKDKNISKYMKYRMLAIISMWLLVGMVLCAPRTAHAATGGGGLPWEAPLTTLSNSITGPVAYGVSIIGIVGAGGILIFAGGQINEFLRAVLYVVLVTAFIIAAKNTMTAFGWGAGAEITRTEIVTKGVGYGVASRHDSPRWD